MSPYSYEPQGNPGQDLPASHSPEPPYHEDPTAAIHGSAAVNEQPAQATQPTQPQQAEPYQQAQPVQYAQPAAQQVVPTQPMPAQSMSTQAAPTQAAPVEPARIEPASTLDATVPATERPVPVMGAHAAHGDQYVPGSAVPPQQPPTGYGTPASHGRPKGNGGKTFVFGFLGALLACVLCLGGFGLLGGFNNGGSSTSTTIGSTDPTVINAVEEGQSLSVAVAAKALPSVVGVYNYQQGVSSSYFGYGSNASTGELEAAGMGSGVIISSDGYILTNYHVVENAAELGVTINGEEREAKYIGGDSSSDVAVLKIENTDGLTPMDIGNSDDLVVGEWVMTIGAPLGLEQSVATGVVSATNRSTIMNSDSSNPYGSSSTDYTYYPNMIQTDAVINPGNSGGALVDADGKLIGINTMISSYSGDYAGVGFAIPVNYAMGIATDIIEGKTPTHAMLGVSISTVNASTAQRYGLNATSGAYINAITPGTGAADSGLQVGDIITAVDGTAVESATDVTLAVRSHAVGQTITVTVDRNGQSHDVEVVLSSDENLLSSGSPSTGNNQDQQQQSPYGNGYGNGNGNGNSQRNIEDLLKLFGL